MKIIQLSEDDFTLLFAAHTVYQEAEAAHAKSKIAYYAASDDYAKVCRQICLKYKLQAGQASDDQRFIYGQSSEQVNEADKHA